MEQEEPYEDYGIDIETFNWGREWEQIWQQTDNGLRAGGASLSTPHLRWLTEVKLKQRLAPRLSFGYQYKQINTYSYKDEEVGDFEIEYHLKNRYYVSIVGRPFFLKRKSDFGVLLKYQRNNAYFLHFAFISIDVFNNFLYELEWRTNVDREIYLKEPYECRLTGAFSTEKFRFKTSMLLRHESVKNYTFFDATDKNYIRNMLHNEGMFRIEYDPFIPATIGMQVCGDETLEEKDFAQSNSTKTFKASQRIHQIYLYYIHQLSKGVEFNIGGKYQFEQYNLQFPYNLGNKYTYKKENINPIILLRLGHEKSKWIFETGYIADFMQVNRKYPNNLILDSTEFNEEHRIKISFERVFSTNSRLKFIVGADLDEWDEWGFYDHAGIFLTTGW